MFGYLLISRDNNVILMDGDILFLRHIAGRVESEVFDASECASTSSGICSDVDSKSPSGLTVSYVSSNRKSSFYKEVNKSSLREVAHIFLPLISLYRATSEAKNDAIASIQFNELSIRFKTLNDGYLIMSIGNSDSKQNRFMEYFSTGIQVNLGPLLELIGSELVPVKNAKENIRLLLESHCKGNVKFCKDTIDIRQSAYYSNQLDRMMPLLRSACNKLHLFIGPNRCLLISHGQILASSNSKSDDRPMWKQMKVSDVQCALELLDAQKIDQGQIQLSQCWLRSSTGVIPYYVNLFRVQLSTHLHLVCLAEAKHDHLIRTIVLLYGQLQQLISTKSTNELEFEIKKTLIDVERMLLDLNLPQDDTVSERAFLRNTKKTADFLNSLWNRLTSEIRIFNDESEMSIPKSKSRRFSLITLKRAISNVSLVWNPRTQSQPEISTKKNISLQFEVLVSYFRRQLLSILQELCCVSTHEAEAYKLKLFQDAMPRIIRPQHERIIANCNIGDLSNISNIEKIRNFMRPVDMSLDMLSYSVTVKTLHLTTNYVTDEIQKEFDEFPNISDNQLACIDMEGKSGQNYLVFRISAPSKAVLKISSTMQKFNSWLTSSESYNPQENASYDDITATAVFPPLIHKQLAARQMIQLTRKIYLEVLKTARFYT